MEEKNLIWGFLLLAPFNPLWTNNSSVKVCTWNYNGQAPKLIGLLAITKECWLEFDPKPTAAHMTILPSTQPPTFRKVEPRGSNIRTTSDESGFVRHKNNKKELWMKCMPHWHMSGRGTLLGAAGQSDCWGNGKCMQPHDMSYAHSRPRSTSVSSPQTPLNPSLCVDCSIQTFWHVSGSWTSFHFRPNHPANYSGVHGESSHNHILLSPT